MNAEDNAKQLLAVIDDYNSNRKTVEKREKLETAVMTYNRVMPNYCQLRLESIDGQAILVVVTPLYIERQNAVKPKH